MQYQVGKPGRMIVVRLEENEPVYESIQTLCKTESVATGVFWIIGGVQNVDVVTGPEDHTKRPVHSLSQQLEGSHEILGTGTIFPNAEGEPTLHMHASLGHNRDTVTGCPRNSLDCWLINEIVIQEMTGIDAARLKDETSGFTLLTMENTSGK